MRRLLRAVLLIVVGGVVAAAAVVLDARPAEPCGPAPLTLRVAAAPDIAPAVRRVAAPFTRERHAVSGRCVTVAVTARTGADVASALVSGAPGTDAWVADASAWAGDVRRARGAAFLPEGPVIAVSPLVFAVRRDRAARVRRARPGWHAMITTGFDPQGRPVGATFRASVPDPARSATGIAALSALRATAGSGTAALTHLAATVAALPATPAVTAAPSALPAVATEQEVASGVRGGARVAAVYPADGSPSVAYRYLVSSADRRVRRAAWELGARLLSARADRAFRAAAFRGPSGGPAGFAATAGLDPAPVVALAAPADAAEPRLRRLWARRHPGARVLVVLDTSASMAAGGTGGAGGARGADRLATAAGGVRAWLSAMGGGDAAGLWTVAGGGAAPYREVAPVRPLDARQRAALAGTLAAPAPGADGGLDAAILAAYDRATRDYRPGRYNGVVVVTGGRGTRAGASRARTLRALAAAYDPRRPVDLGIVAFGPDTDERAVRALALAAHGTAWTSATAARAPALLAAVPPHLACASWCP